MSKSFINSSAAGHLHNHFFCVCVSKVSPAQLLKIWAFSWEVAEEPPSMRGVWVWTTVLFIIGGEQPAQRRHGTGCFSGPLRVNSSSCALPAEQQLCVYGCLCVDCRGHRPDQTGTAETQAQVIAYFIHKSKKKMGERPSNTVTLQHKVLPSQKQYSNQKRKGWNMKRTSDS